MAKPMRQRKDYYHNDIDFEVLSARDEDFCKVFKREGRLNWQDPDTIQVLTRALLRHDFGLDIDTPADRLCPPVPVRWNYVRWIQDLLSSTSSPEASSGSRQEIIGLDIGTGASAIYSLLACTVHPAWRMIGTDIDDKSVKYARKNVLNNSFDKRIIIRERDVAETVIPLDDYGMQGIDFTICNPPFYASTEDMNAANVSKLLPPSAICTGSAGEMICEGGDLGFALRIFQESQQLLTRVKWYSCMLCRLASAKALVQVLKDAELNNFAVANLKAGQKTARWAVAWSYTDHRPSNDAVRHGDLVTALLAPATERSIFAKGYTSEILLGMVDDKLCMLDLEWHHDTTSRSGIVATKANVWSRSARRKNKSTGLMPGLMDDVCPSSPNQSPMPVPQLVVKISCLRDQVDIRWIRGQDAVLFESFCGMMRQTLGQRKGFN